MTGNARSPLPDNEPRTGQVAFVVDELSGAIDDWIRLYPAFPGGRSASEVGWLCRRQENLAGVRVEYDESVGP